MIKMTERKKIWMAMNITPHLIGRQPKQVASPTLSWEHAHMQQQHGLKLYISGSVTSDATYGGSSNGLGIFGTAIKLFFSSGSSSLAPAASSLFSAGTSSPSGFCSTGSLFSAPSYDMLAIII